MLRNERTCYGCQYLKIIYEPYKQGGILYDFGKAMCEKYHMFTDFRSHSKFKKLRCVENKGDQDD